MKNIKTLYQEFRKEFGALKELAKILGVHEMTIQKWRERKSINYDYAVEIEKLSDGRINTLHIMECFYNDRKVL